jgi:hypothetical protein
LDRAVCKSDGLFIVGVEIANYLARRLRKIINFSLASCEELEKTDQHLGNTTAAKWQTKLPKLGSGDALPIGPTGMPTKESSLTQTYSSVERHTPAQILLLAAPIMRKKPSLSKAVTNT